MEQGRDVSRDPCLHRLKEEGQTGHRALSPRLSHIVTSIASPPGDLVYLLPRLSLPLGDARQAGNHKFSPSPESSAPSGERTLLSTSCSIDICLVIGWREG